jgi:peptide/nickel transport system permease protein
VTRLVRSLVLSIREEPYVEAAVALGHADLEDHAAPHPAERDRAADRPGHVHLRLGDPARVDPVVPRRRLPSEIPTWGNIMAEGRVQFNQFPHNVLFPGIFLR